jgi:hypothetical protein
MPLPGARLLEEPEEGVAGLVQHRDDGHARARQGQQAPAARTGGCVCSGAARVEGGRGAGGAVSAGRAAGKPKLPPKRATAV